MRLGPTGEDGHGAFRLRPRRGETRVWGADAARPVASGHGFSSDGLSSAGARRARAMKGVCCVWACSHARAEQTDDTGGGRSERGGRELDGAPA